MAPRGLVSGPHTREVPEVAEQASSAEHFGEDPPVRGLGGSVSPESGLGDAREDSAPVVLAYSAGHEAFRFQLSDHS
jgi:hypothetical protein